jgi:cobalt-zinc-cadmium efflux system membrane fusion protein
MNRTRLTDLLRALARLAALGVLLTLAGCGPAPSDGRSADPAGEHASGGHGDGHGDGHDAHAPLVDGDLELDLRIVEDGVPPEYRARARVDGEPLAPERLDLMVRLERLGGRVDEIPFEPEGEGLVGTRTVDEPHSFDVRAVARHDGHEHVFEFASHEGRTTIPAERARRAGVTIEPVGPATVERTRRLQGTVRVPEDLRVDVHAPYAGIVTELPLRSGQRIAEGDLVARVRSTTSLEEYEVRAPRDGHVITVNANVGAEATESPLIQLADLSRKWIELAAFPDGLAELAPGQTVRIDVAGMPEGELLGAVPGGRAGQARLMRAAVADPDLRLAPGQRVLVDVVVERREVPRAVRVEALQRFRGFDVVFMREGDVYEVRMLDLGLVDGTHAEVLGGIAAGVPYVVGNSFLIKADVLKAGASHAH